MGSESRAVGACIIFYNKLDQTIECINSLLPTGCPIYVLNNGSDVQMRQALGEHCAKHAQIKLIDEPVNVGACRGRNRLIDASKEQWLLFLDNDVRIGTVDWLPRIINHIGRNPAVEVLIPRLYNVHESGYQAEKRFEIIGDQVFYQPAVGGETNIFPGGAAFISRSVFERLGKYEEEIFIGFEEAELCLRGILTNSPVRAKYISDIELIHDHRVTSELPDKKAVERRYSEDAMSVAYDIIVRKHGVYLDRNFGGWLAAQRDRMTGQPQESMGIIKLTAGRLSGALSHRWRRFRALLRRSRVGGFSSHPLKLFFVLPTLYAGGGVEQVTARLIRYFSEHERFLVTVVAAFPSRAADLRMPPGVELIHMGGKRGRYTLFKLTRLLLARKPDIIYSAPLYTNILATLANLFSGKRAVVIGSEHAYLPAYIEKTDSATGAHFRRVVRLASVVYRFVDHLVFVSEGARQDNSRLYRLPLAKSVTIPNAIDRAGVAELAAVLPDHPWFAEPTTPVLMAVGRFSSEKRFDWLVRAFALVAAESDARLVIFGEGDERARIEAAIAECGLADRVSLPGLESNPYRYMARCDGFLLSSAFECCPSVILEALACGAPIVSVACPVGPPEILTDGVNGLLTPVDDAAAFASAALRVLNNSDLAAGLRAGARERAADYDISVIGAATERLFRELLSAKGRRS
jgi:glycosyltransferase involved in cell wall biosynthesis/GT2 family glycosyltransferase